MIDGLVATLPPHLKASFDGLLQRPASTREHMLGELDAYTQRIDDAARRRPAHGFDDDAEVLSVVLDALRRSELKVRI